MNEPGKDPLMLVEDDPGLANQLKWALADYQVTVVQDRESAVETCRSLEPGVVVLDLGLPPDPNGASEGLATLEAILSIRPETKIVVSSGNEDRGNAVQAISMGAYDFYPKPVDIEILQLIIQRAMHVHQLEVENRRLSRGKKDSPLDGIIAASDPMLKVCRVVERIAPSDVAVLLTGESGSGKEVLAHAIHILGDRKKGPFIAINCAAIPENLLESELFGHEKGAFTGAVKQTQGKVEQADGGTLFLDEIGDMPLSLQAKMLRFLQSRSFERVGGRKEINVDVRIVSATNRDLAAMMKTGEFREDLFYRLNEVGIEIPPLRERGDDAVLLANHFLLSLGKTLGKPGKKLSADAISVLSAHHWPGNVRELENRIKRALVLADGKMVSAADLDIDVGDVQADFPTLKEIRDQADLAIVTKALALARNNVSTAAKLLGVSRPTLYELMKNLNLRS